MPAQWPTNHQATGTWAVDFLAALNAEHNTDGTHKVGVGLPTGYVDVHKAAYNCPTNGTSDCATAFAAALADCPVGGALLFRPIIYALSSLSLSTRPDVHLIGLGGLRSIDSTIGTIFRPFSNSVNVVECIPTTLSQYGPTISGITINNIDAKTAVRGFHIEGVNGWSIKRCGAKYMTGSPLYVKYGLSQAGGSDAAWSDLEDFWTYQCDVPITFDQILNANVRRLNQDVTDTKYGLLLTNYAQNIFINQWSVDGQNVSGVAKGTAFHVDTGGAHDVWVNQFKWEACALGAKIEQAATGPGTANISFMQGSVSGVNSGTADGKGFDVGSGVTNVVVEHIHFQDITAGGNEFIDPNSPSTNRWVKMSPSSLVAAPTATQVSTFLHDNGLAPKN